MPSEEDEHSGGEAVANPGVFGVATPHLFQRKQASCLISGSRLELQKFIIHFCVRALPQAKATKSRLCLQVSEINQLGFREIYLFNLSFYDDLFKSGPGDGRPNS